jgi:DNA polymerase III alpha subunit
MEDETGIANIIVSPDLYERNRLVLTRSKFLIVDGTLQNADNVMHFRAVQLMALADGALEMKLRDFHWVRVGGNLRAGLDTARTAAAAHKPGDHQANRQPCSA